jgi:hypothetical protein
VVKVKIGEGAGGPEGEGVGNGLAGSHKPVDGPPGQPWLSRLPWTFMLMVLGIVLALGAIALTYAHQGGGIAMFVVAALAFAIGLVGLLLQNRQDAQPTSEEDEGRELRIHRQVACGIELPLLKKLIKAEATLEGRIRDRNWTADWDDCKKHFALAEQHLHKGSLTDAFREYCRAMRPLSEAVQQQRHKEEVFQPIWDKNSD